MQIKYVTSMSGQQWEEYGQHMLESHRNFWPEAPIEVFSEDAIDDPDFFPLLEVPGCADFLRATALFPVFSGLINQPSGPMRFYQFDVHHFARKVFAQISASLDHKGLLFWIDADVTTTAPVPRGWLEEMMVNTFCAVMKRKTWHMCTSFVGWDCTHEFSATFWMNLLDLYVSGRVFTLPQWEDCTVLERALDGVPDVLDIAESYTGEGPYNVFDQVFEGMATHRKGHKGPRRYQQLIDIVAERQPERIIEIGTWDGTRAVEMCQAAPKAQYYGFDYFEQASPATDAQEKNVKEHFAQGAVAARLRAEGIDAYLSVGDSKVTMKDYLAREGGASADLIYIDGGHSKETVESDYLNAMEAIKPGGMIVFDDYYTEMPDDELAQFGCQSVIEIQKYAEVLPVKDPVKGGGYVQMATLQC
jgi:predicted O-methyltransferase YrrM